MCSAGHIEAMRAALRNSKNLLQRDYGKFSKDNIKFNAAYPELKIPNKQLSDELKEYYKEKNRRSKLYFNISFVVSLILVLAISYWMYIVIYL